MGFMPGKNSVNAIFAVKPPIEKYGKTWKGLYFVLVDLEKAFGCVPG